MWAQGQQSGGCRTALKAVTPAPLPALLPLCSSRAKGLHLPLFCLYLYQTFWSLVEQRESHCWEKDLPRCLGYTSEGDDAFSAYTIRPGIVWPQSGLLSLWDFFSSVFSMTEGRELTISVSEKVLRLRQTLNNDSNSWHPTRLNAQTPPIQGTLSNSKCVTSTVS